MPNEQFFSYSMAKTRYIQRDDKIYLPKFQNQSIKTIYNKKKNEIFKS